MEFGGGWVIFDKGKEGKGCGEREAFWTNAAGVEVEDSVAGGDGGLVGVAVDDRAHLGGLRIQVEVSQVMEHVDQMAVELEGFCGGKKCAVAVGVDVAADGGDWGDGAEGFENARVTDVAGVENVIDARYGWKDFGAEYAVGVG
jgi:hypothetical protein